MVQWSYSAWSQQPSLVQQQISLLRQDEQVDRGSRRRQQNYFIEARLVKSKSFLSQIQTCVDLIRLALRRVTRVKPPLFTLCRTGLRLARLIWRVLNSNLTTNNWRKVLLKSCKWCKVEVRSGSARHVLYCTRLIRARYRRAHEHGTQNDGYFQGRRCC